MHAPPVQRLITELGKLPGIGNRTAQRLAFHILRAEPEDANALADAIREVKEKVGLCEVCFNLAEGPRCRICQDERRDPAVICVVEEPGDVIPVERTHEFRGRYHVLGGALSPIDGVDPEDLKIAELFARVARARSPRSSWRRTRRPPARRRRCTSPPASTSAPPASPSRASPPVCRSAATSSTPTRSPSAARSRAVATSRPGMRDPETERFVLGALPPAPARVLEVGAGRGELAEALRAAGHDVLAIDPRSETPAVTAVALAEVDAPPASFDAAVGAFSMHHVEPLPESCRRLAELVRPGGALVLDEFDVAAMDERAAGWWLRHREAHGHDDHEPAAVVADLRRHCHPLTVLLDALGPWFDLDDPARGPYLHRWARRPDLLAAEEDLIAAGELPVTGARLTGTRR